MNRSNKSYSNLELMDITFGNGLWIVWLSDTSLEWYVAPNISRDQEGRPVGKPFTHSTALKIYEGAKVVWSKFGKEKRDGVLWEEAVDAMREIESGQDEDNMEEQRKKRRKIITEETVR